MKFVHVVLKSETGKLDSDFSTARGAPSFHVKTMDGANTPQVSLSKGGSLLFRAIESESLAFAAPAPIRGPEWEYVNLDSSAHTKGMKTRTWLALMFANTQLSIN
ncbi:protein of unknown function [Hyphomicrobium sp. MC1]|nr:protein of unknown function [Hyphomicrobium sp. MC1]